MQNPLSQEIEAAYTHLINAIGDHDRSKKVIDWNAKKISLAELIAYQIGWGSCLIRWYEAGIHGKTPDMPGEGFKKWDYRAIAAHFFEKYGYDGGAEQAHHFEEVVRKIANIAKEEEMNGNLTREGVWPWCTLSSGKKWPLEKWIRVNTVSPYKRATGLIKKARFF